MFRLFIVNILVPLLFISVIWSSSDISNVPHENDVDWDDWNNPDSLTRQSGSVQNCSCGVGDPRLNITKILGGVTSRNHAWPWAAAIVFTNSTPKEFFCTGSLLSNYYVLTAAHCADQMIADGISKYNVYLGSNRINGNNITNRTVAKIAAVKRHPSYIKATAKVVPHFDIALIRLSAPVKYSKYINPVCLSQTGAPFVNRSAIAMGWGTTKFGGNSSNTIREVVLKVISNAACNVSYADGGVGADHICATRPKKDVCSGDSGGPLIVLKNKTATKETFTQIGVTSFNRECSFAPAVFTRLSRVINFIKSNIKNSGVCSDTYS